MFTPPSVNQIAKAYQGNPAPLGQKVEADKQRNGGIPSDLRQLLALNDITQGRNAMGIQQALQIPTNMPTVAEDLQERARQALQARMMQQAQQEQSKSGQPNVVPMGTPRPPMQAQGLDSLESNVGEGYAEGGIVGMAIGGDTKKALEDAYAAQDYDTVNSLVTQNKITDADVRGTWGMDTSGLADLGVNLYQPPAAVDASQLDYFGNPKNTQAADTQAVDLQNTPFISNNNAFNTPTVNPVDKEIFDYFAKNQNLVKNKDYDTIASDMYVSGWTPEMAARAIGANVTDFTREYDKTYGAFDRAKQENLVNQKYKKLLGLTDEQLGQTNFGAPMDTRENRRASTPLTLGYRDYQEELAATGRRDAPAGTQFRAKAVYMPDSIGDRGSIKLIDTATGQELTNLGGANSMGNTRNAFELLDKFAVDPASYRQAASQMYESLGKPTYMQDDYKYLTGYKPRDVAGATDAYLRTPLAKASVADLKYNPEKDANNRFTKDTRTNIDWLGSTQRLLMSKGMGASEATNYLHQFIPVAGLVDWVEISKSKDPVKAIIGTLNYLQSKGVTNLDPNRGPFSKIGQTRFDAAGKKLPARYTGAESLRSLGLRGFASGGIASLDSNTLVGNAQHFKEGGAIGRTQHFQSKGLVSGSLSDASDFSETFDILADRPREAARKKAEQEAEEKMRFLEMAAPEVAERIKREITKTSGTPVSSPAQQPDTASIRSQLNAADAASRSQPGTPPPPRERPAAQTQTRVNADSAPMPGGLKDLAGIPSTSVAYSKLTEMMNQDPEVKAQALRDRYMKEVGSRDLSIYDRTAAELEARKQKLNAPKAGYDALMEYLEQIAIGGGRTSAESGALGASRQRALQKSRLAEQDTLMDKILELGAKKSEAQYAEKKGMFDMTQKEREEVYKKAFDAAKSVNASDDEAKRIAAQAVENEKNRQNQIRTAQIGAQDRDQLMNRAKALMAVDKTLTLEQAMTKAALAAGASSVLSTESRDKAKGMEELRKLNTDIPVAVRTGNSTFAKDNRRQYETTLAALENKYGPLTSGINTLPSAGGPTSSNVRSQADAIISGGR